MSDDYRKRRVYIFDQEGVNALISYSRGNEEERIGQMLESAQSNPHVRAAPTANDKIVDMLRRYETGEHLTDAELKWLYEMFIEAANATRPFPMYGAAFYHAIQQVKKIEEFMWARGMQSLVQRD